MEPRFAVFHQAAQDDAAQFVWDFLPQGIRRRGLLLKDLGDELYKLSGAIRSLASEQMIERRADGINIGAQIQLFAAKLLRGSIRGCAHDRTGGGEQRFAAREG